MVYLIIYSYNRSEIYYNAIDTCYVSYVPFARLIIYLFIYIIGNYNFNITFKLNIRL